MLNGKNLIICPVAVIVLLVFVNEFMGHSFRFTKSHSSLRILTDLKNVGLYSLISFCIFAENLEAKMKWLKNYERVQEIQQQIFWQPITELDPRAFIPEVSS